MYNFALYNQNIKIMKTVKISLVFIFGLFINLTSAQLSKGNWLFEGNMGNIYFGNTDSKNVSETFESESTSKNFSFDIYPRAGYFITNNLVLGSTLGFGFSSGDSESTNLANIKTSESKYSSSYISLSPFIRYYFPGKDKLRFYGQIGSGLDYTFSNKSEGKSYNGTTGILNSSYSYDYPKKYNTFFANGLIGLNYFVSNSTAINSSIGYYYSKGKQSSKYTSTDNLGNTTVYPQTDYTVDNSRIQWLIGFTVFIDRSNK